MNKLPGACMEIFPNFSRISKKRQRVNFLVFGNWSKTNQLRSQPSYWKRPKDVTGALTTLCFSYTGDEDGRMTASYLQ